MEEERKYGVLLNKDAKLHRKYFIEMTKLIGIQVIYRAPLENTVWNGYGEFDNYFKAPQVVGCIFDEHPDQKTTKKMGWVAELQENSSMIHVPYDLEGLQIGALFIIPSGLDHAKGRIFRVTQMQNSMIYPSSIACELVPEYENTFEKSQFWHKQDNFNLLDIDPEELQNTGPTEEVG